MIFLTNIDLNENQLQNCLVHPLPGNPLSPSVSQLYFNTGTNRLRTWNGATWDEYITSAGGGGTVTSFAFTNANGFSGSVATSTTTPTLTLSTSINGLLKGNGTALSAAALSDISTAIGSQTANTFYAAPSGSAGNPTFRAIVALDIPTLNQNTTGNATTATTATNLSGGAGGSIPYQSAANTTAMLANGTAGQVLTSQGTTLAPIWSTPGSGSVTSVSGTAGRITSTGGATPVINIDTGYVGQASITTLGTITTGTWNASILAGQYGGTGVANTGKTITIGGNFTTAGAFTTTLTVTGNTSVTLPTTGTLATLAGTEILTNKTINASNNTISNIDLPNFATGVIADSLGAPISLSSTDNELPTAQNVYEFVSTSVASALGGISWKASVRAATTAPLSNTPTYANGTAGVGATLTAGSNGILTVDGIVFDGVTAFQGDEILVKDQANPAHNGIYTLTVQGTAGVPYVLTRFTESDTAAEIYQAAVFAQEGTVNADKAFVNTASTISFTMGTSAITFTDFATAVIPDATTSVKGKVQLATQAEAEAKVNTTKAVTPVSLVNFGVKLTTTIGNGVLTSIPVTHTLGQYVLSQVFDDSTNAQVYCDVVNTNATTTTFTFATAPTTNQYRVILIG